MKRNNDGDWKLTVAGALLFGKKWSLRRLFPSTYVDYIRVKGTEWIEDPDRRYEDSIEIREPLVRAVRQISSEIVDDLPTPFALDSETFQRKDEPIIPVSVIREAVANALMHRCYRTRGATQIIRYDNRIEVRNPGHSLKPRDELHQPGSELRNPTIASVLRELGFVENKGSGIQTMRRLMREASLTPPTFESNRQANRFVAEFLFHHFLSDEDLEWLRSIEGVEHDEPAALALVYVREMGSIDNAKIRDLADLDTLKASQCLGRLRDAKLLTMEGAGPATYYEPGPAFPSQASDAQARLELPDGHTSSDVSAKQPAKQAVESHKQQGESHKQSHKGSHKASSHPEADDDREVESTEESSVLLDQFPVELAARIREMRTAPPSEELQETIVDACAFKHLSATELASLFDRERRYFMRAHVKPLIEEGRILRRYPESPKHPRQRYCADDDDSSA